MFHDNKHVNLRESSPEKSPIPEKFHEPDGMISVELSSIPENVKQVESKKFEIASIRNKMIKLFLCIAFLVFSSLTFIMVVGKFEKGPKFVQTTAKIPEIIATDNTKYFNFDNCLKTQHFEDCCTYEDNNGRYITNPDCTVDKILKIFAEFEEYYSEFNKNLNDIETEIDVNDELDLVEYNRNRRQIANTREPENYEGYFINNNPQFDYSNRDDYVELDGAEIANAENVYGNDLYSNNHETINYMENVLVDAGSNNEEMGNNADLTSMYGNNDLNEANIANPYNLNVDNVEYNYLEYEQPILSNSNEDVIDENSNDDDNNSNAPIAYKPVPIQESNKEYIQELVEPVAATHDVVHTWNYADNSATSQITHPQTLADNQQNSEGSSNYNFPTKQDSDYLLAEGNVPVDNSKFVPQPIEFSPNYIKNLHKQDLASGINLTIPDNLSYNPSNFEAAMPQDVMHHPTHVVNNQPDLPSNNNFNVPAESLYNPTISPMQAPINAAIPQENAKFYETQQATENIPNNDYILKAIPIESGTKSPIFSQEVPKSKNELDVTTPYSVKTTLNLPSNLQNLANDKLRRDSFTANTDATKINMNSRDFQISKSKLNQFQGANIDLQTSQHSTINSNFNGRQCQLVGSSYPYAQQFPFNYDASQGTQFAQLVPVNMAKSNPYVVPSYNVIQPNYVYQPINNPLYPYSYNPYYNSMSSMIPPATSSVQAITSNGQYYICNPIAQPTNSIVNMPGVEIRDNSMQNLQDLLDGSVTFQEVNNKTRASDKCPFDEHMCADNMKCIKRSQICDSHVNCNDASDEAYCSCKYRIGSVRLCDGYFDCPNGEDELACFGCGIDSFSCDDWTEDDRLSTCVPLEERCDGKPQCPTGKDEEDCSILTTKIADHQINKVSNSIGFLHHNYKGKWYPACSNPETWAVDACNSESGPSTIAPLTHMIPAELNYEGSFINSLTDSNVELVPACVPGRAVYVQCPEPTCGIRKLFRNPYRQQEVDTSMENFLTSINRKERNSNFSESILRVVGGRPSQPAAWPWVVSVYRNGIFHCGGTILNSNWIITAAHCVDKYWQYYYEVEAGILRRFSYSPMEQNRFVSHVVPHKDYDRANLKNDLALMRLSAPLRYNRYVRPICLPNEFTAGPNFFRGPSPGTICTAVGWGATVEHGTDPDHLREVDVPILSHCKHIEDEIGNEICAGLSEGGRDACQGDSGGPFLCRNPMAKNQWYLAGIVSHGEGCARPHEPGVYTRVSKYIDWIFRHANEIMLPKLVPLSHCPGYSCRLTSRCLPKRRRCDKIVDCLVGDDEMDCDRMSFRSLFKNTVRQMYLGVIRNVSDWNNLENLKDTNLINLNKLEDNLNTTKEDSPSFATLLYTSDKNEHITNNNEDTTPYLYTDITTENYKIDESLKELILTTKSQITTTEFAYAERVKDDIVSHLNNVTDKIDATFLCKRMLEVIPLTKRCNKIVDCQDGSDEENCKCLDYLKNIQPDALCDGITDCYDLSDEDLCSNCKTDEFRCRKSNRCIPNNKICDGTSDCPLDEDEWDCVILTNGVTVELDEEMRPMLNMKGIITINNNGSWKPLCANWTGIEPSTAADVCISLGFTDYKKFQQLSVNSSSSSLPLNTRFNGTDSILYDKKTVLNQDKCDALYVKCTNTTMDLTYQIGTESKFKTTRNLYNLPWNAAVYVDGKYECIGIILKFNWILTSAACFNVTKSIYITVLLGTMKPYLNVGGPHDQVIRVADVVPVPKADMFMLRLVEEIKITRYVRPALFRWKKYVARNSETCLAVDKKLNLLHLSPLSDSDCHIGYRCFKRISSINCTENDVSSGYIICNDGNGWYPATFYHNKSLECDFRFKDPFISISYNKKDIFDTIDRGFNGIHTSICKGYRCLLGGCIKIENICDGISHCSYAEDEKPEFCSEWYQRCNLTESCPCLPSEIGCLNGKCIKKSKYCDDINDCGDWSDEPLICDCANYLKLSNASKICDGEINCYDKSDEDPSICKCTENSYVCQNSSVCVINGLLCDGIKQCPNGDDEDFCQSLVTAVNGNKFGELYVRTSGVWHNGCFSKNTTVEELNSICVNLGFEQIYSSYNHLPEVEIGLKSKRPVIDSFNMVYVNDNLKFPIRTGNEPYLRFKEDENCNRLFIHCM